MALRSSWRLRLGDFDFSPGVDHGDVTVRVTGLLRGSSAPVVMVMNSLIQGGDERVTGWEPREQQIAVGFQGGDPVALSDLEAVLFREVLKGRNELEWVSDEDFGEPTIFDVMWSRMVPSEHDFWDLDETRGLRSYVVTIRARPWGRSVDPVVDGDTGGTAGGTVVNDCSSTTGWTVTPFGSYPVGTLAAVDGHLEITGAPSWSDDGTTSSFSVIHDYTYTPAAPVDLSTTGYLQFDYWSAYAAVSGRVEVDGVECDEVSTVFLDNGGVGFWKRTTVRVPDGVTSAAQLDFLVSTITYQSSAAPPLTELTTGLDNVVKTGAGAAVDTVGRQSLRTIEIQGSAPTEGSLSVQHETDVLDDVLVYTNPALRSGYSPQLRRWLTDSGATSPSADAVSGEVSASGFTAEVPIAMLPRGGYVLMARVYNPSGTTPVEATFTWSASTVIGTQEFGVQTGSAEPRTFLTEPNFTIVPIGGMVLPPTDTPDESPAVVRIVLAAGTAALSVDEAWLFHMGEDAALTQIATGAAAGGPAVGERHNRLWIDSPSLARPAPSVWVGTLADRSDAFHAGELAASWGRHQFPAEPLDVFVVTTNAANAAVNLTHYPRHFTHAVRKQGT